MKMLKPFFDFYIYSSLHVALSVFSLTWITLILVDIPFDQTLLFFVFFASITGYNFVKYFGLAKFHHRSLAPWLKIVQVFSFLCFAMMCFFGLQLRLQTLLCIAGLGFITFLYAVPFLPKRLVMDTHKNLRNIGGLKVYVIAMVWACVTVLLPLINNKYIITADVWLVTVQRFIFVILLMLPFEIRDLRYDSLKLSTIPQKIGIKNTKLIGIFLAILCICLEFFKDELMPVHMWINTIVSIIALIFLLMAKKDQNDYYSSFWVEGIPMIWLFLLIIL